MKEPTWLDQRAILLLHQESLAEHGGSSGIRDRGLLDSALARPQNQYRYEGEADLARLAAAYGFALAKNHAFVDGNKRIAFIAVELFLRLNGYHLKTTPIEEVHVMLDVSSGQINEDEFAAWIRANSKARS